MSMTDQEYRVLNTLADREADERLQRIEAAVKRMEALLQHIVVARLMKP